MNIIEYINSSPLDKAKNISVKILKNRKSNSTKQCDTCEFYSSCSYKEAGVIGTSKYFK